MKSLDDWIEERIRWKASKQNLPRGNTFFFSDTSADIRTTISDSTKDYQLGKRVILAFQSDNQWTLIGTRQTVGKIEGTIHELSHNEISEIRPRDYPPPEHERRMISMQEMGRLKGLWEILCLISVDSREELFWVPHGSEAFAIWNILLMLQRMQPQKNFK